MNTSGAEVYENITRITSARSEAGFTTVNDPFAPIAHARPLGNFDQFISKFLVHLFLESRYSQIKFN